MNHEIWAPDDLHNPDGTLRHRGWARRPWLHYRREAVRAAAFRIKEWDYYFVGDGEHGLACTVADNGYLGFVSATVFDFAAATEVTKVVMTAFPLGRFGLPTSSEAGDVVFEHRDLTLRFQREPGRRRLTVAANDFGGRPLDARLELLPDESADSLTIATPFPRAPRAFYYNQKINNQPARGEVRWGDTVHRYDEATSMGVLDWGRGVWTYQNTWYWASASGRLAGRPFGFNLGYGFGDTSAATENILFFEGRGHKLDAVSFHIPVRYLNPWAFHSNDGRFEMDFVPILDRASCTDLGVLKSDQHQVFGRFTGKALLDDGRVVEVRDFFGFAEKVFNRW